MTENTHFVIKGDTNVVAAPRFHFVKFFDAVAEYVGEWTRTTMGFCLYLLTYFQAIGQLFCTNQTVIGSNTFIWAKTAALLNNITCRHRVELCPGTWTGRCTVHGLDVGAAWAQGRKVDTDAAASRHNLCHGLEVVEDTLAAVFRAGDNVAVIECDLVARSRACQDAPTRHKLEIGKRLVKAFFPVRL